MNEKNLIYNLEFPQRIHELNIAGYRFTRIAEYEKAYKGLQHLVTFHGQEFETIEQTGGHQITATLEYPDIEKPNVLPWENGHTILHDVLLLLTLFTGRSVFRNEWGTKENVAIRQDSRRYLGGNELSSSIHETLWKHEETGEVVSKENIPPNDRISYRYIDIGFEKNLNKIIELMSTKEWQAKYENGYFLFIFRQAIQQQIIDTSFILCWSIWEHIVTLHHKKWLSREAIIKLNNIEKISFILSEYFLKEIDSKVRKQIKKLSDARNRIMHYGRVPEETDLAELLLFTRLTEQLIAMTLGLKPSNVLNSGDELQKFLDGKKVSRPFRFE